MSKITASADIQQVKPEEVQKYVDLFCQDVTEVVNGKLDFVNNFASKVITASFTQANTDTVVTHNLGRATSNFLVASKSASCDIYNGSSQSTNSFKLKSTVVPVTVTLVVF